MIISEASFATSVPVIPIAKPTFAAFNYGASFEPSPVAATTKFYLFNKQTKRYLSFGDDLAIHLNVGINYNAYSSLNFENSGPVIANFFNSSS